MPLFNPDYLSKTLSPDTITLEGYSLNTNSEGNTNIQSITLTNLYQ